MDTILIVDDEPDLLQALRAILEEEHFRVVECNDGHEARLRVFEDPPDLIISDIHMPGMNGWELVEELQSLPLTRDVPFLFLTGHADQRTYADALRSGIDGVMMKPIHPQALIDAVNARLRRTRQLTMQSQRATSLLQTTLSRALPHGLNTPLHIIKGHADLLANEGGRPEEIRESVRRIQQAADRLHSSLQKLWLLLSLEESSHAVASTAGPDEQTEAPLVPLLKAVVASLPALAGRPVELPEKASNIRLRVEMNHASEALREVIENAHLFSPPGTPITISAADREGRIAITVTDQGRGLSAEPIVGLDALAEFQRSRFEKRGHGLGLTLVHRLVRQMGGNISISGVPGSGTAVTLILPGIAD